MFDRGIKSNYLRNIAFSCAMALIAKGNVHSFLKKRRCNFLKPKLLYYHYFFVCLLIASYYFVNNRFNQIQTLNIIKNEYETSARIQSTTKSKILAKGTDLAMKFILLWTNPTKVPFAYFSEGNSIFVNKSCEWTNCYVTGNRSFLEAYTDFDVIVFNGPQLPLLLYFEDIPMERKLHQKYVYANIESAANYPCHDNVFNGFFNWTWTYKLNSDAFWGYIVVRDANNSVIGPREYMHWIDVAYMDPIDDDLKLRLRSKTTAAAWLCSNCETVGHREDYIKELQKHLNKYNLKIDVYGDCGDHKCPREIMPRCLEMLQRIYYFYLAFENSFSEDYVTEKILYALNHETIPVVYGGANYSRFLPEGSYLDAVKLDPQELAEIIHETINDQVALHRFFRWKKYYSYHSTHENPATDVYCNFCAMINNKTLMNDHKTYEQFNAWWMHKVTKIL